MQTLRIAIDGNEANCEQRVGSNVYAHSILRELEQLTRNQSHISVTVLLSQAKKAHMPERRSGWRYQVLRPQFLWTQWALPIHLFQNTKRYDVFFTPGHYAPRFSAVPYVSSVMDTAYLKYPEQFRAADTLKLTNWTEYSVKNAQKVITISEFSKQEIVKYYQKSEDDVVVAYPSIGQLEKLDTSEAQQLVAQLGVSGKYFLYVGTLQPRKNLVRVIKGFAQFCRDRVAEREDTVLPQLVLAGKVGWLADQVLHAAKSSEFSDQIIVTGYVDECTKAALYSQAEASILVGLYEGFGMPPLESLAYGCTPIVSNTTSLPEAVGEAGILVDPMSTEEIATALLETYCMSKTVKAHWRKAGREQVRRFSWRKSAQTILSTLNQVAFSSQ